MKFSCPKCDHPVSRWKPLYMTNFTKIKCTKCSTLMRPNKAIGGIIGGAGGGILAGLGSQVMHNGWQQDAVGIAVMQSIGLLIAIAIAAYTATIYFMKFIEVTDKSDKKTEQT